MTKINLMHLVEEYKAESAEWEYVEDTTHKTRGVMHWVVRLNNVTMPRWESTTNWWKHRKASHTITLANGADLITDDYIAHQVIKRLENT